MSSIVLEQPLTAAAGRRSIARRTKGRDHGAVTRLFSPGDLGGVLKPFVFLDRIHMTASGSPLFGFHPHSGIVTVTTVFEGDTAYEDSTGEAGVLAAGGVEWMQAGGGVWHTANPTAPGPVRGYQLWLALPAALEVAEPRSAYLAPGDVPQVGPARVVLGRYGGVTSPLPATSALTYLHVRLHDGESWTFEPPPGEDVAWLAVDQGALAIGGERACDEVVVFDRGAAPIPMRAIGEVNLMIGASAPHPHELVTGDYSVHTSAAALATGEAGIRRVAERLRQAGTI